MKKSLLAVGTAGILAGIYVGVTKINIGAESLRQIMLDYTALPVASLICCFAIFLILSATLSNLAGRKLPKIGDVGFDALKAYGLPPIALSIYVGLGMLLGLLCGYVVSVLVVTNIKAIF